MGKNKAGFSTPQEVAEDFWYTNDIKKHLTVDEDKKAEYNNENITWCSKCKSLLIINSNSLIDTELVCYCGSCGSVSLEEGHIDDWLSIENKIDLR